MRGRESHLHLHHFLHKHGTFFFSHPLPSSHTQISYPVFLLSLAVRDSLSSAPLCTLVWLSRQRLAPHKPQCHKVIHQAVSFHFCPPPRAILFAASQVTLPRCRTARWLYSEADPSLFTRRMKQGWWKDGMQGAQMCLQSRKYVAELPSLRRFPWSILTHQWCDYCRKSQRPLQDDVNLIIFHAYGRFRVLSV